MSIGLEQQNKKLENQFRNEIVILNVKDSCIYSSGKEVSFELIF